MIASVCYRTARASFVHYHTDEGNYKSTLLFSMWWRLLRRPYGITTHSFRPLPAFESARLRRALASAYKHASLRIAISDATREAMVDILNLDSQSIAVVPSTFPISNAELHSPLPPLPAEWQGAPIRILANAGRLVRFRGEDLYGLDVLVRAMQHVPDTDVHVLLAIADVVDETLQTNLTHAAKTDPRIHIIRSAWPLARVASMAHIVVRPTRTEGGPSLTLNEAIELGVFAIGSDAVERPAFTRLFRNGDADHLSEVLRATIADVRRGQTAPQSHPNRDIIQTLVDLYARAGLVNTLNTPAEV